MKIEDIPIEKIHTSYNPRMVFSAESLQELEESILKQGILVPLKVRPIRDGEYDLIYGERRLRAAQELGFETVPCLIEEADDWHALIQKGIENISRGSLHFLEEGAYFAKLLESPSGNFETQADLAKVFGISQPAINVKLQCHKRLYETTKSTLFISPASLVKLRFWLLLLWFNFFILLPSMSKPMTVTFLAKASAKGKPTYPKPTTLTIALFCINLSFIRILLWRSSYQGFG
jgi:ParB/RepB/Spo0J family partition protein